MRRIEVNMIKIGDFSKLSRISIRMLRHYNEIGLLMPSRVDDFTGYRYYSETLLPLANRISALKEMGFSLAAITEILKEYDNPESLMKFLTLKYAEIREQAESVNRQMLLLETTINQFRKDGTMNFNVLQKEMPARYVASVRKIIVNHQSEAILWEQLMKETAPLNMHMATPSNAIAIFHDDGYKENDVDVEVQVSVEGKYADTENVIFKNVDPIQFVSVTFKGGYEQTPAVSEAIASWATENHNHYDFDGAMFNIYHVNPAMEKNSENWVTEACCPITKKQYDN